MNSLPTYIMNMFTEMASCTSRVTRSSTKTILKIEKCKLKTSENSLRYMLPKIINSLSVELKIFFEMRNLKTLSNNIKVAILKGYSESQCSQNNCYACSQKLFFLTTYLNSFN